METPQGTAQPAQNPQAATQRRIELRHASLATDATKMRRIAHFTDGSLRQIEMQWGEVRRVVAFRRDVMSNPVQCIAVSDQTAIVVLDEWMEGWRPFLDALGSHIAEDPTFSDWRAGITAASDESHWTILFRASE